MTVKPRLKGDGLPKRSSDSNVTSLVPSQQTKRSARDKIRSVEELCTIRETAQAAGESVVLCHGVFDLLHMGHVRHLEAAKREGDILTVVVTEDSRVNKGPGRPVFSQYQRAEMVAALGLVDWVGVNAGRSAAEMLRTIQPDVYVKGSDYADSDKDVTGNIAHEQATVEAYGGRLAITDDVVFSSSSLINRHLDLYDPALSEHLDMMRERVGLDALRKLIDSAGDKRVLMIGETIIDDYQFVVPLGKSPKENMIATAFQSREVYAGGVIAAANHVASFCREVEVLTGIGMTDSHLDLVQRSLAPNVVLTTIERPDVPTTRKCRFIDPGYMRKLFEVYFFDDSPLTGPLEQRFRDLVADRLKQYDIVAVTDFGHGLITPSIVDLLARDAGFLAINCQSNSANLGYNLITKYPRADYICIDEPEARLAAGDKFSGIADVITDRLAQCIDYKNIIVTHGKNGCYAYDQGDGVLHLPALTTSVTDTVGAGDAFFAVSAPMVAGGGELLRAGFIGNAAGAMKVGIVGHRQPIEKIPLTKFVTAILK